MKHCKKLLALLLALVMTLALSVTAFAAGNGSITIENATPGKEYKLYKVFDASYGASNTASYTIDESSPWYNLVKNSVLFTLENTTVDRRYTVSANADAGADIIAWFNSEGVKNAAATFSGVSETADSATVKFENLDYGYYFISSTLGATVTITNVDNAVTIIDKNQTPGWGDEKESGKFIKKADGSLVRSDSADIGQTVNFVVKVNNALNYDGVDKIKEYVITDTMGAAIDVDLKSIVVKVNGMAIADNLWRHSNTDNGVFTIHINWQDDNGDFLYPAENSTPNTIEVTYTATLKGNASVGNRTLNNTNEAALSWKFNTVRGGEDPTPSTVTVHTFAIGVFKHNNKSVGLGGAVFELRDANNTLLKLYKLQSNGIEDIYYLANEYNKANIISLDTDTVYSSFTTPADGKLVIKGLKAGTYTLTEITAPAGYNLLKEPVTLTISETSAKSEIYELSVDQASILNSSGTELPETGGIGTVLFVALGALAVVGAGIFLVTNKRISKENF